MAITINPNGPNNITLKLAGPTDPPDGKWVAAKLNALIAEYNTLLDRRAVNAPKKVKGHAAPVKDETVS